MATLRQEDLARKSSAPLKVALARTAAIATTGLSLNATGRGIQPIGYINLERLEMAPAGIVRGELVATIPLAPLEETAVVQKEWSVTSKEFTSIVTDSLENYSETGVTDNTKLARSTTSQNQHSNQFNITGTVSGGIEQTRRLGDERLHRPRHVFQLGNSERKAFRVSDTEGIFTREEGAQGHDLDNDRDGHFEVHDSHAEEP